MLNRHGHADDVAAVNKAAVAIAREAFGGKPGYVLGDIGPFGGLMEPYGEFTEAQVRDAFNEQAKALVDAGADAIIIETQTSLEELQLAIEAAKAAGAPCIIGSMAYDVTLDGSTFRTMMGIDPERAAEFMEEHGAHVVALNCGTGMDMERARDAVAALPRRHQPAGHGPAERRPAQAGEHEGRLRRDARGDGLRRGAAARGRRQHRRRLLRQHARPHPRVPPAARRPSRHHRRRHPRLSPVRTMTITLCPVNAGAIDKLPAKTDDKSGVGVHYVDAYIKPMNVKREDGIAVKCKRRGLKIVLTVKGEERGRPAAPPGATVPTR